MLKILNLTQHVATAEQVADGVFEPSQEMKNEIRKLLTFDSHVISTPSIISRNAKNLANLVAKEYNPRDTAVMIGGAPFFMAPLANELMAVGYTVLYSFTDRVSVDVTNPDGTVTKTSTFKHLGFVQHVG